MKRRLAFLFFGVLLAGLASLNLNAQGPADTHVNAAKAVATKAGARSPGRISLTSSIANAVRPQRAAVGVADRPRKRSARMCLLNPVNKGSLSKLLVMSGT
jgi:hypothetical protein